MAKRFALVIANTQYTDTRLSQLTAPLADAHGVASVLRDPEIGGFDDVRALVDEPQHHVQRAIVNLFAQKSRDDLVVLYFSGHGVRDEKGALYLAAKETELGDFLEITSIPAGFITKYMDQSASRRQVLILDCCYSGAFSRGIKASASPGTAVVTGAAFEGNGFGRVVLTAADALQFAWEGNELVGKSVNSVFTHHFVRGLRTGLAGADKDEWISIDEIYNYVCSNIDLAKQVPGRWIYGQRGGELNLARNIAYRPRAAATGTRTRTAEDVRLFAAREGREDWKHWGPYLSERAWGTVREDYSEDGTAWEYFPHDHARSRAYRWNEDGLLGICDDHQYLCFAPCLWNGRDAILKERPFGLTGTEGNHGEDCKEHYFYLDSTPTHSYLKALYQYPQRAFPYEQLVAENRRRSRSEPEFELIDTGIFSEQRYFDIEVEYAKASENDMLIRISVTNRAIETAPCVVLATAWFRNTWSWGYPQGPMGDVPTKPGMRVLDSAGDGCGTVQVEHPTLGTYYLYAEDAPAWLFTDNETNTERLFEVTSDNRYFKDAFHDFLIHGRRDCVNPDGVGTKSAAVYRLALRGGERQTIRLRLSNLAHKEPFREFDATFDRRLAEADQYFTAILPAGATAAERAVQRRAIAGMLWTKQFYYFDVQQWLTGDPGMPVPSLSRRLGRNVTWSHIRNFGILSVPDKWEYPWYGAWDLALHCVSLSLVDSEYAKRQVELLTSDSYMRLNGQLPAYEWSFDDVGPPLHAWAALEVYLADAVARGQSDEHFLERVFQRLLLNFSWWANRKDVSGKSLLDGGELGVDSIGVFDRSRPLPSGGVVVSQDSVAWMALYALSMMKLALELARNRPETYESWVLRFADCFSVLCARTHDPQAFAWDEATQFLYPQIALPSGEKVQLRVRSLENLILLFCSRCLRPHEVEPLPALSARLRQLSPSQGVQAGGDSGTTLLSVLEPARLRGLLRCIFDESEFLSPFGLRSMSRFHLEHPLELRIDGAEICIQYEPGESSISLFGGNTNLRGPIWLSLNYLAIQALYELHRHFGPKFEIEFPSGSGTQLTLDHVAQQLTLRLLKLFEPAQQALNEREYPLARSDDGERVLFYEYFDGDNGRGLGASHFTGWTGLIVNLVHQLRTPRAQS